MSAPPYMKLYWGDYHRATRHLNRSEHGAYFLLLGALWDSGGKLPADDHSLAKYALCTPDEWSAIRDTILPFFRVVRGKLTQKRVSEELSKYENTIRNRKVAGKRGGEASARKHGENRPANAAASAEQKPTYSEPEPEPEVREEYTATTSSVPEWREMLEQAKAAAGDAADLTRPAMHHAADLRALVEPNTGEPCTWGEVLDAIAMTAMRQRAKRRPITSWSWVRDDALALRDKRLQAANPDVADVIPIRGTGPPGLTERIAAEHAEARRRVLES